MNLYDAGTASGTRGFSVILDLGKFSAKCENYTIINGTYAWHF